MDLKLINGEIRSDFFDVLKSKISVLHRLVLVLAKSLEVGYREAQRSTLEREKFEDFRIQLLYIEKLKCRLYLMRKISQVGVMDATLLQRSALFKGDHHRFQLYYVGSIEKDLRIGM